VEASVVRITAGVLCKIGLKAESILFTHHMSCKLEWWERVIGESKLPLISTFSKLPSIM
jgi:hypothetical protein